jgi:hypothetical protein
MHEQAIVFKEPWRSTKASWQAKASNLFSAVLNSTTLSLPVFILIDLFSSIVI